VGVNKRELPKSPSPSFLRQAQDRPPIEGGELRGGITPGLPPPWMGEGWGGGEEQYCHLSDRAETCLAHPPLTPPIKGGEYG